MQGGSEGKEGKKREREGKRGGKEREWERATRHTNPSLLPAPLIDSDIVSRYCYEMPRAT